MASFSIFALLVALQAFLLVSGAPAPAPFPAPGNSTNITTHVDAAAASSWWFASITRQGTVPYGTAGYKVFRNVMDYGAKGDGSSDDTVSSHISYSLVGVASQRPINTLALAKTANPLTFSQL
jgi:hypothetical protein